MAWLKRALAALGVLALSFAISALALLLLDGRHDPAAKRHDFRRNAGPLEQYEAVSLVALLANPERYDGRKVSAAGFVTLDFEGSGLHLDKTAYEAGLRKNALWIDRPASMSAKQERGLGRRYGSVAGTFDAEAKGHLGLYSGALTDVQLIRPNYTSADHAQHTLDLKGGAMLRILLSGMFLTFAGWTALAAFWIASRLAGRDA